MLKRILPILLFFGILASCEENAEEPRLNPTVASNELQALTATNFVLDREQAGENFQEFKWTAPDFGFPASITYVLQMDRAGNNFATPVELMTTQETTAAITVGDMNKKLLGLSLEPDEAAMVEFRVRSAISDQVQPVYSNVQSSSVTPYATDFPPVYLIGDATGGWDLAKGVEARSIAPNKYETTAMFTNGGTFRFFATPSWDAAQFNWSTFEGGTVDAMLANANDNDGNFSFTGTTGWYKITADVKNKTIVMEAVDRPALYMIGSAIQGWDLAKAVEMERIKDGQYRVTTNFTSGETFRFFTKLDWPAGTINYPYFDGGSVDPMFVNAEDGDKNFKFVGTTGEYTITVDLYALTVEMEVPGAVAPPIYMIGDATGGWDLAKAVEMPSTGSKQYETTTQFTKDGIFRFFEKADWSAKQYKWMDFDGGTVDPMLKSAGGDDDNFLFTGETGSYKITVNTEKKTIVMAKQ